MRYLHMHEPFVVGTLENDLRKILYHFDSLLSTFSIRANNQQYYCDKEYGQTFSLPVIILHINNPSQSYGRVTMKVGQGVSINTLLLSHHCRNHRSTNWLVHHLCCFCLQQFPNRSVWMNASHVRVISQYFISKIFGNPVLDVCYRTFFRLCVLIPVFRLLHLASQLFKLF